MRTLNCLEGRGGTAGLKGTKGTRVIGNHVRTEAAWCVWNAVCSSVLFVVQCRRTNREAGSRGGRIENKSVSFEESRPLLQGLSVGSRGRTFSSKVMQGTMIFYLSLSGCSQGHHLREEG